MSCGGLLILNNSYNSLKLNHNVVNKTLNTTLRCDLRQLPKAHLHIHLEGAMRLSTLTELCQRYQIPQPENTQGKTFENFGGFVQMYWAACSCIRSRDDLARVILEVAEDAAEQGVWWIEPAFDSERYSTLRDEDCYRLFDNQQEGWLFALQAAEAAERATGVGIGFVSAADRAMPVENALERARVTAQLVASGQHMIESGMKHYTGSHAGIAAFGLHGNEQGFPPEPFAEAFKMALSGTELLSTPHAGEIAPFPGAGPDSVSAALDHLGARRIMHGVLAIHDLNVVERLAREKVCLDVCPSSNLLLSVFPSSQQHPLADLLAAGVPCSLNSDDPLLFGPDLLDEFVLCHQEMGLNYQQLAQMARASFQYSAAPESFRQIGMRSVDQWLEEMS